jgi:hypothetical protein
MNSLKLEKFLHSPAAVLRRWPFTLVSLAGLTTGAWLTSSHAGALSIWWHRRLGFAPLDLWAGRWERLVTSALVTDGGQAFWRAAGMIALAVGAAEWLAGTRRAALTFWGVHLATLLTESLFIVLPLHQAGAAPGFALLVARDVGPSAGYLGCLGLACARFPNRRWGRLAGLLILAGLGMTLFQPPSEGQDAAVKLSADLAHLIAFPLGWLAAYFMKFRGESGAGAEGSGPAVTTEGHRID